MQSYGKKPIIPKSRYSFLLYIFKFFIKKTNESGSQFSDCNMRITNKTFTMKCYQKGKSKGSTPIITMPMIICKGSPTFT